MIITRRSLLTAGLSLVAAPALVRADSLMPLRGTLLDPWVLAIGGDGWPWQVSAFNEWNGSPQDRAARLNAVASRPASSRIRWAAVRLSECKW